MREKSSVVRFSHHDECIIRFLKRHAHVHSLLLLFRYFSTIAAAAIPNLGTGCFPAGPPSPWLLRAALGWEVPR